MHALWRRAGKIILDKPSTFKEKKENKGEHKLNARDIREWLERIPDEHLIFLGMDKDAARPEWTIMKVLPVPPITVSHPLHWTVEIGPKMISLTN